MRREPVLRSHQAVLIRSRRRVEKLPLVPVDLHEQDAEGDGIREDLGARGLLDRAGEVRPEVQALRPYSVLTDATDTPTAPKKGRAARQQKSGGGFEKRESELTSTGGRLAAAAR